MTLREYQHRQVVDALKVSSPTSRRRNGQEITEAMVIPGRLREAQLIAEAERHARLRFIENWKRAGGPRVLKA